MNEEDYSKETRNLVIGILVVILFCLLAYAYQTELAPKLLAAKLVDLNDKYAFDEEKNALGYGEALLPFLERASSNFAQLNGNTAGRIGRVIGAINSPRAKQIGHELYARDDEWSKLTGAYILVRQKEYTEAINDNSFLIKELFSETGGDWLQLPREFAAEILANYDKQAALPFFVKAAAWGNDTFSICRNLPDSDSNDAIPGLKRCFQHCYDECGAIGGRLLFFGETEAITIAINGLGGPFSSEHVLPFLKAATGQSFGDDHKKWSEWWKQNRDSWTIPQAYRDGSALARAQDRREEMPAAVWAIATAVPLIIMLLVAVSGYRESRRAKETPKPKGEIPQDLTAEQIKLLPREMREICGLRYAKVGPRACAMVIDYLIFYPLIFVAIWSLGQSRDLYIALQILALALPVYNIYFHGRYGATIGKKIIRIKVCPLDGSQMTIRRAFYRHAIDLLLTIFSISAVIGAALNLGEGFFLQSHPLHLAMGAADLAIPLWGRSSRIAIQLWVWSELVVMLFNDRRRAAHDYIAGTVVVHTD